MHDSQEAELDQLLFYINRKLPYEQQIAPDDPAMGMVLMNQALLQKSTESLKTAIQAAHLEVEAQNRQAATNSVKIIRDEIEEAKELAGRMIDRTGDHIKEQLLAALNEWEKGFMQRAQQQYVAIHQVSQFVLWTGGALLAVILLIGTVTAGNAIGGWLNHAMRH